MLKIGLTGNIASGKSEVEKIIKNLGYKVYDLDKITHSLYENKIFQEKLFKIFKTSERKEISKIVFNNKEKLKILENIIHPELKKFILNLKEETVFVSGALLFETGFNELFDKIIFIDSNKEIRLERLIKRNNITTKEAEKIMSFQTGKFKSLADFIIMNNSSKEELEIQVANLIKKLKKEYFIL